MHVHLCLCLCLCFDRGQRCLVHLEELRSSCKSLRVGAGKQIWVLWGSSTCSQWLNHLSSPMKYFWWPPRRVGGNIWNQKNCSDLASSFQFTGNIRVVKSYRRVQNPVNQTHCWHPTVKMSYTFINELYKGTFYNKEMYFSRFSKSQFMPNSRGDKTFVVDS